MTLTRFVLIYILIINIVGFACMGSDKHKAKKNLWRIPEKTLFLLALAGGSAGTTLGMHLFHHKTRHWYFLYGMPAILVLQTAAFLYFVLVR